MRSLFFDAFQPDRCCLCGARGNLTSEHKIKASAIRAEFGSSRMIVVNDDGETIRPIDAQGPRAKALQFEPSICHSCNSFRTQQADREFDRLHRQVQQLFRDGENPSSAFNDARYKVGSQAYLNVFRYFSKLLCCHIAKSEGPRPVHMSRFAIGRSQTNCIWLNIRPDWTYQGMQQQIGSHSYAAHGGLVMYASRTDGDLTAFHSTLTIGAIQYVFFSRLNWFERKSLKYSHRQFHDRMVAIGVDAINNPIPTADLFKLGLIAESDQPQP